MRRAGLLIPLMFLLACDGDSGSQTTTAAPAASQGGGVVVVWLDDEQRAAGSSFHRIAGTVTAPRSEAAGLRRIARDALVDRARELGFVRLDDMQIESSCDDAAPEASACQARVIAVASR